VKILYLCPDLGIPVLGRKGASVHVRGLVAALCRIGPSVILSAPLLNKSPWEEPASIAAQLLHLPPSAESTASFLTLKAFNHTLGVENSLPGELRRTLYNQDMLAQLTRRFENDPPDFIYERASLYATAGVSLARELCVPMLVELNTPLALEQSVYRATGLGELALQAERYTLSRADAVLAVSAALRDHVVSLGVASERVHVVPNGVDASLFRARPSDGAVRQRWGLDGGPVLGYVGGLRRWHGVAALPPLLERLGQRYRGLRLVIVGNGPLRGDLERDLRLRGLLHSVVFTGARPHEEIAALIGQFDVALAPYAYLDHAFYFSPLKLFEYMACGVPVVAAASGQIAEVVQDGETGLLYPPGDLEALTAACGRLLADSALRQRLGQPGAREVHSRYTWDHNAARVTELACSLLAARRGDK
jgi:glycosyltransferase involved in cell wall biosynthesis